MANQVLTFEPEANSTNAPLAVQASELSQRTQWVSTVWQRLPSFRGKMRLGRWLLRTELSQQNMLVMDKQGNRFVIPNLVDPTAQHLLLNGVYEPAVLDFICSQLSPDAYFVDVGANLGLFSISVARRLSASGRVIAIEASPVMYDYLQANITLNQVDNITACCVAASDSVARQVPFYEAPSEKFGMGSLAHRFHDSPTMVPAETLDALLDEKSMARVQVLKIDVEGFEMTVLRGAARLLAKTPSPWVVFEFVDWAEGRDGAPTLGAAQQYLRDLNYDLWRLEDWRSGAKPLETILTEGSAMLVARRRMD
jgi:FkbM family methyltransferase